MLKGKKFLLYQLLTSIIWIAWMSGWFIFEDIVINDGFGLGSSIWYVVSIWYLLQLYLPVESKIRTIRFILQIITYSLIQAATWVSFYLVDEYLDHDSKYITIISVLIVIINAVLIQIGTVLIHTANKKNRIFNKHPPKMIDKFTHSLLFFRFRILVFLGILTLNVLNYFMQYGPDFSWGWFFAHWASHILPFLSFIVYFKRRLVIHLKNGKLIITHKNQENIIITIPQKTPACPNCGRNVELKNLEFPEGASSTNCLFCGKKILKVDVIPVDKDTLVDQHQKMIQQVSEFGSKKSTIEEEKFDGKID